MKASMNVGVDALKGQLAYAIARAGWAGALGVALAVFAIAVYFGAVSPLLAEQRSLQATRDELAQRVAAGVTVESPREQLDRFDAALAQRARLPSLLASLARAARASGLSLARVESRESQMLGAGYARQDYIFPIQGKYTALRAWLADAQRVSPAVMVEDVLLRRADIGRDTVDATVRIAIVLKDAP